VAGLPGTRVYGLGPVIVIAESGQSVVDLDLPAYVTWRASADGTYPEQGNILVEKSGSLLTIPHQPLPRWSMDAGAYGFSFGELRCSFSFGNSLFARATLTEFVLGISLSQSDGSGSPAPLCASYGLLQPGLGFGGYFEGAENPLRTYMAVDAFARVAVPEGRAIFIDPVAPLGIEPCFGIEWGRSRSMSLYFEIGGIFYPVAMPALMLASMGDGSTGGRLVFGGLGWFPGHPGWFMEFPVPRLGLRFHL
jgi:hypothetical protein